MFGCTGMFGLSRVDFKKIDLLLEKWRADG